MSVSWERATAHAGTNEKEHEAERFAVEKKKTEGEDEEIKMGRGIVENKKEMERAG